MGSTSIKLIFIFGANDGGATAALSAVILARMPRAELSPASPYAPFSFLDHPREEKLLAKYQALGRHASWRPVGIADLTQRHV